jgi:hypothetical protein
MPPKRSDDKESPMLNARHLAVLALTVMLAGAGCSQEQTASEPRIIEQTAALAPATLPVTIGPLNGELSELSVLRRVDESTGNTVYAPQLRGTLILRNTSEDVAVRLVGGQVTYLGAEGKPIALAAGRGDTAFSFSTYSNERLDPGKETRHSLDLPFPAGAFEGGLRQIKLDLDYLPIPYQEGTVTVGMTVGPRR